MHCRNCNSKINKPFLDLDVSPPSNSFYNPNSKNENEYPLLLFVCKKCWLVQVKQFNKKEELFDKNYPYLSGTSKTWITHCKNYFKTIQKKLNLNKNSCVVEIASNDGTLLENFYKNEYNCYGIEPTSSTAKISKQKGIKTFINFFDFNFAKQLSKKNKKADLLIANNVFAHVPNLRAFTKGLKEILKSNGTLTIEFPHLLNLIKYNQYDTIYHEHFSYFSLISAINVLKRHNLKVYDLNKLKTHGGSLRIYVTHSKNNNVKIKKIVNRILEEEIKFGIKKIKIYKEFEKKVIYTNNQIKNFFLNPKIKNKKIVGYAAAAKGNTLLNFAKITNENILFVCDNSIYKQNKFLPGSHIPIYKPNILRKYQPDYIIILAWNIYDELIKEIKKIYNKKVYFVRFIPKLKIEYL